MMLWTDSQRFSTIYSLYDELRGNQLNKILKAPESNTLMIKSLRNSLQKDKFLLKLFETISNQNFVKEGELKHLGQGLYLTGIFVGKYIGEQGDHLRLQKAFRGIFNMDKSEFSGSKIMENFVKKLPLKKLE